MSLNFLTERGYLPPDQLNDRDWSNITLSREDVRVITSHIFCISKDINPIQFLSLEDLRIMLYFYSSQGIDYSWFCRRLEEREEFADRYRANCTNYGILVAKRNVHKGNALKQFASMINIAINRIAKFGDQGQKGGNDHELLAYPGSFSVYRADEANSNTFNCHELFNISNAAGTLWVLERLNFVSPDNSRIKASMDMPFIQFKATYQAAAFDMDGTLLSAGQSRPSEDMYRMLASLLENGIPIVIITARNAEEMDRMFLRGFRRYFDEIPKNLFLFLCNGAALLNSH
ncbi:MAG: HAD hydrolase family protein [Candidatus Syntrophoarchaeum sp.]|nr:HAD hydrolase family protein [Candidatus Syntrophoarchaeum sp.]